MGTAKPSGPAAAKTVHLQVGSGHLDLRPGHQVGGSGGILRASGNSPSLSDQLRAELGPHQPFDPFPNAIGKVRRLGGLM